MRIANEAELIMAGFGALGVLIYFFGFLRPLMRASAARGQPWRMFPVCVLSDYCDGVIARKRAEKDRLLDLARERVPRANPTLPPARASRLPPLPFGRAQQIPSYSGRVSISNMGPAGELFVFLDVPLTDAAGRQHIDIATDVLVPPEARPFIEACIHDQRMVAISGIPANAHDIRLRMTVEETHGRLVPMQQWILEQARGWQPTPPMISAPGLPHPRRSSGTLPQPPSPLPGRVHSASL